MEEWLRQGRQGLMPIVPFIMHQRDRKAQDYLDDCKGGYNFVSRGDQIASETLRKAMKK